MFFHRTSPFLLQSHLCVPLTSRWLFSKQWLIWFDRKLEGCAVYTWKEDPVDLDAIHMDTVGTAWCLAARPPALWPRLRSKTVGSLQGLIWRAELLSPVNPHELKGCTWGTTLLHICGGDKSLSFYTVSVSSFIDKLSWGSTDLGWMESDTTEPPWGVLLEDMESYHKGSSQPF